MDLVEDGGQEDRGRRDIQGRQVERRFIRPVRGRQNWLTQALRWAAAPSWRRMVETNHDGCEQECGWLGGGLRRCPGGDAGVVHNRPRWHLQVRVLCHRHRPHRSRPGRYGRHPTRDPRRTEACRALRRAHRPRTRREGIPAPRRWSSTAALELAIRPGRNPWPASGVAGATSAALETKCPVLPGDSPRIHPVCLIGAKQRLQAGVPPGVEEERLQGLVQDQRQVAPSPGYLGQLLLVAEAVT